MALHPKVPTDLALAPVAAAIDLNLQRLRDKSPADIDFEVALSLNIDTSRSSRADRQKWILEAAMRDVNPHDWDVEITRDADRLRLAGGSVTLDIGLSATILDYIEHGVRAAVA
jgi:hypothetical protein